MRGNGLPKCNSLGASLLTEMREADECGRYGGGLGKVKLVGTKIVSIGQTVVVAKMRQRGSGCQDVWRMVSPQTMLEEKRVQQ